VGTRASRATKHTTEKAFGCADQSYFSKISARPGFCRGSRGFLTAQESKGTSPIFAFHRRAPFGKMLTFYLIGSTIIQSIFTKTLAF
jgi:hypothetical protein